MHETIFALKRVYQATQNAIDEGLAKYDLTWAQLDILLLLYEHDVQAQRELQIALGVTSATLTRTVNGLVKRGFIQRQLSSEDGRAKNLQLSEKAHNLLHQLESNEDVLLRQMFLAGLSISEVVLFTECLRRIAQNMGDTSDNKF
jgi:MarR family transcriptional regulator for hemolysin